MKQFNNLFFNKAPFFLLLLFLPTQLGKHFFFDFSFINGVRIDYLAPTIYFIDVIAALLAIANWRVLLENLKKNYRVVFLFLLLTGVNVIVAHQPIVALYGAARLWEVYILFVIFSHRDPSTSLRYARDDRMPAIAGRTVLLPLFIGSCIELILSIYQVASGQAAQGVFYWLGERAFAISTPGIATISLFGTQILRAYGTFSHPNSMGGFYVLIYAFVLWASTPRSFIPLRGTQDDKIVRFGVLLVTSCLILISFSKIAILVYLFVTVFYVLKESELSCRFCTFARLFGLGVVSALFLSGQSDVLSWEKRVLLIKQSLELLARHPLFGIGLGNSLYYQSAFTSKLPYSFIQPVHNIFLLFATETGIVTVFVITLLCARVLEPSRFLVDRQKALFWCLIVIGVTGFFDHYWLTLVQNQIVMGVVLGMSMRTREGEEKMG